MQMPMPAANQNPLAQAPANVGPVAMQQANQGNIAAAMIEVKNAVNILQKSLPLIPMGSPLHTDILNFVKGISKHLSQNEETQGIQIQSLLQMAKQAAQSSPMQAMARMFPPQTPNSPPAMPGAEGGAAAA